MYCCTALILLHAMRVEHSKVPGRENISFLRLSKPVYLICHPVSQLLRNLILNVITERVIANNKIEPRPWDATAYLYENLKRVMYMIGSTYCCEQIYPKLIITL